MNKGIWLAAFLCCGWPLIVHAALIYLPRFYRSRDWNNIQWNQVRWPWSKDND